MGKLGMIGAVLAAVLLLTGCGEPETAAPDAASTRSAEVREEPAETATPEATGDPTAPGAVCDPQSGNDFPCLVAYPDLAVTNMTAAGRSREPLSSMAAADRIALAHQACEVLVAGGTHETDIIVETVPNDIAESPIANNFNVFSAGAAAYCPEYADAWVQDALSAAAG